MKLNNNHNALDSYVELTEVSRYSYHQCNPINSTFITVILEYQWLSPR